MSILNDPRWRMALVLALLASLSGVLLVGVSAWFLGAVALAGLGPAAFAFGFHHPAAIVRLLALVRTTAKYGERVAGHSAALRDQTLHRRSLFVRMANAPATRAQGWQLARADRLQAFLGDVERVDFDRLRSLLPLLTAISAGLLISLLTFHVAWQAVPFLFLFTLVLLSACRWLAAKAADRQLVADDASRRAGEALGQQLAGLVSLEGGGERAARVAESVALARTAERHAVAARQHLGAADALLSVLGPVLAMMVLAVAAMSGKVGEAALPSLLAAFSWLAFGELIAPLARAGFARRLAKRAASDLAEWSAGEDEKQVLTKSFIAIRNVPLRDPSGLALGSRVSLQATPGEPAAILGPSGCGKTTLLKQLAGWLPWRDGPHPLGSAAAARAACHLSLHDAAILDGSVRDNLFSEAGDRALWAALDAVELTSRISDAGGLGARLTQGSLSLGEARRVALARAILTDAPIVLLDEPGEHLDSAQAERIMTRLLDRLKERTIVFVTHEPRLAALAATQEIAQ